jgi:hypothetical protein
VHAHRAAQDPRHQDVALDLLRDEEEAGDYEGLVEATDEERDQDRGDGAEEGPDDGDDLHQTDPQPDQERVSSDDEERYGRPYDTHDRAENELPPEVLHQAPLDGVEELDGLVPHRVGDRAEHGAGDPLPIEEEVYGDYEHQQEVKHGAEDAEDPTDKAAGRAERLPGGRGVALHELRDRLLVYPGDAPSHVGQPLRAPHQRVRPLDGGGGVLDQGLHLLGGGDDEHQERGDDGEDKRGEHPHHRHDPRDAQPLEMPHHGVEDVGQDRGHEERQQHAAELPDEEHQQDEAHGDQDVLQVCRDDEFFGGHHGLRSRTLAPKYTSPRRRGGKFTGHRPLCIIVPQYARG